MKSVPSSLQDLATRAKGSADLRRIDPVGRAAYGVLCIAVMVALSVPLLFAAGVIRPIVELGSGDGRDALMWWLVLWGAALVMGGLFLVLFYTAWPLASDWIMEWPGYVVGFAIAGACLVLLALMMFAMSAPAYIAIVLPLLAAFGLGFLVAGKLAGLKAPSARPRARARTLRRR